MKQALIAPQLNPNDHEVEITHWYFENGSAIRKGDLLCDLSTSKATFGFEAEGDGFLQILRPQGSRIRKGENFGAICSTKEEAGQAPACETEAATVSTFSRKARERLREFGLSEKDFTKDYVTEADVLIRARGGGEASVLSLAKEKEIQALQAGQKDSLRSSLSVRVEIKNLLVLLEKKGVRLVALNAWLTAQTLAEHPGFLTAFREGNPAPAVDIGYAIDLGKGPKLLLAANSAKWTLDQWNEKIADWSLRLMRNEVRVEELGDGRFSITDLSSLDVSFFEPLLVQNQSAILGIGADLDQENPALTLTLAFDHRVHSGRDAALFLQTLKNKFRQEDSGS